MAGYVVRQFTCPKAVTHPSTNRARCTGTALTKGDGRKGNDGKGRGKTGKVERRGGKGRGGVK